MNQTVAYNTCTNAHPYTHMHIYTCTHHTHACTHTHTHTHTHRHVHTTLVCIHTGGGRGSTSKLTHSLSPKTEPVPQSRHTRNDCCWTCVLIKFQPQVCPVPPSVVTQVSSQLFTVLSRCWQSSFIYCCGWQTLDGSISGCSVFGTDDIYLQLRQFTADRASCQDHRYVRHSSRQSLSSGP